MDHASGDVIVFIDSDLVVTDSFLACHASSLVRSWSERGDRLCFTYGAVVNTANFEQPTAERHKLRDLSWAYFATGNVAIDKDVLQRAGLFDTGFRLYGWEDLELGERLRQMGVELIKCPAAVGYHWHPALTLDQIPRLIQVEGSGPDGTGVLPQTSNASRPLHHSIHLAASPALGVAHPGWTDQ